MKADSMFSNDSPLLWLNMPADLILALDLGTTGNRVLALGAQASLKASAYRELEQLYPKPGWVEHDPEAIWQGVLACLAEVCGKVDMARVAGLGLSNQRETTILWERKSGKPIANAIVWQCRRTAEACQALKPEEAWVRGKTGLLIDPYFSASKIAWLLEHVPGARARAEAGELCFGTVDSWVLWRLTGGRVHATDASNASRTLLYDIHSQAWDPALLSLFGVPLSLLPQVMDSAAGFGRVAQGLPGAGLPILAVLGDQQAGLFGQGGWRPGLLKATFGTGIFLMRCAEQGQALVPGLLSTTAWRLQGQARLALEGSIFMGGAVLQWLRDNLGLIASAAESQALAESLPGNEGVYFVPAFQGLGAPHWDPQARGALMGLSRASTKAHVVRAALESLAFQTRDVAALMGARPGGPGSPGSPEALEGLEGLKALRVDGGACANDFLMQFLADICQLPVERPLAREATALGIAGLAGEQAGLWSREAWLAAQRLDRTFSPGISPQAAEHLSQRWQEAVRRARAWAE
jgi:glycerol kinase